MDEKQIIELYWERSEDAIKQTEEKYGQYCAYIANNILRNTEEAATCVKKSYERLWDTIPPRRPKNLRAYLGKITRYQALHNNHVNENMELVLAELKDCIPETMENEKQMSEQYVIELAFEAFLKGLEPAQYKLFIARYWYLATVSEMTATYKMSEAKIHKNLAELRQKLKYVLEKEKVFFDDARSLLYAMTEVEDRYLEEEKTFDEVCANSEEDTTANDSEKNWEIPKIKLTKRNVGTAVAVLILLCITLIWPKNLEEKEKDPTEQIYGPILDVDSEVNSQEPNTQSQQTQQTVGDVNKDDLIRTFSHDSYHKDDIAVLKRSLPWNEETEVAELPVYKNLSEDTGENFVAYMDEDTLTAMVKYIAKELNMNITYMKTDTMSTGDEENKFAVCGVQATTDTGSIEINERGKVTVSFLDGVQLAKEYEMSDSVSIEQANKVVEFLMNELYSDIIKEPFFYPNSYPSYDRDGNRTMNYRAIVSGEENDVVENILNYYFNQVEFYYNKGLGLTGFSYGDIRLASQLVGYYPIVSLEEAKTLLKEGNRRSDAFGLAPDGFKYEEEDILGVELMYKMDSWEDYYQPYYCFYIYEKKSERYLEFYVPAVEGVRIGVDDFEQMQPE